MKHCTLPLPPTCPQSSRAHLQIPGEAAAAIQRLRKKLESPGFEGRRVAPAALTALDTLTAVVAHLEQWDLKSHQVNQTLISIYRL